MTTVNDAYVKADWSTFSAAMAQSPTNAAAATQTLQVLKQAVQANTDGMDDSKRAMVTADIDNMMGLLSNPNFASDPQWQTDLQKLASDLGESMPATAGAPTPTTPVPTPTPTTPVPSPTPSTQSASTPTSSASSPVPLPANLTGPQQAQWQGMLTQETAALTNEANTRGTIAANYAQAGIKAPVDSALPSDPSQILSDPLAAKAQAQMQANYPATGSMDLTQDQINDVYGPAIQAASAKTGVPASIISNMIFIESKGHPLTSNGGLVQIDPVAWGQMADKDPSLKNRYNPADNIMAGAEYLASKATTKPTSDDQWMSLYHAQYQG